MARQLLRVAQGAAEALVKLEGRTYAVVLADLRMPRMNGIPFLAEVHKRWPETVRMVLSANADLTTAMDAVNEGRIPFELSYGTLEIGGPSMESATILVVDDDADIRTVLQEQLKSLGYRILTADSGEAALEVLRRTPPDLVLTDVHMPRMSGIELCARLKADPRFQLTPVVVLTSAGDLKSRVSGLAAGADDFFTKPHELIELRTRVGALIRVKGLLDQLEQAEGIITTLGLTIEARDSYTAGHCERLAGYAVRLGQALGVDQPTLRALRLGGFLHDLGKVAVSDGILLKPGALDPRERKTMQMHPAVGADLVKGMRTLDTVRPIIRHHHERWDGSGYPDGLAGEAIPLGARIMAVVDVYDALVTTRSYKPALPAVEAIGILRRETDSGSWDPQVVTAFLDILVERR